MIRMKQVRRGFTLIELMIVASIITMAFGAGFAYHNRLGDARQRLKQRMNAHEAATRTLERWRGDVAPAAGIQIGDGGRTMTIRRQNSVQTFESIRYALNDKRELLRAIEAEKPGPAPPAEILARDVSQLEFQRVGQGYRLIWTMQSHDGIQTWSRRFGGFATPLILPEVAP